MKKIVYKKSIKTKILTIVLLSIFIITAILGYLSFDFSKRRLTAMISDSIKGIAATTASFIKAEDILLILLHFDKIKERYLFVSAMTSSHIYEKISEGRDMPLSNKLDDAVSVYIRYWDLLSNIKKMNNIESPINIYASYKDGLSIILATGDMLPTKAAYSLRPEAKKALSTNVPQSTGIYRDKNGMWISAYAPIPSVHSEEDRMFVEINYKVDAYIRRLHRELGIIIIICLVGFLMTAAISYKLVSTLVSAVEKLDEAAEHLEMERYGIPVKIKSDDEIGHLADTFEKLRISIGEKISELKLAIAREKNAHFESIVALTNAIEMRDSYTKEHLNRVEKYALLIAKGMRLPREDITNLKYACFLHDIGKIYIENKLLQKTKLTQEDFAEIKKHSEKGAKIIEGIKFLEEVKLAILHHQERYDGKGYPDGLKGEDIPLLARIVTIADAFDAMTTDRPYRSKIGFKEAMDEIKKNAGKQFDPKICAIFLKYRDSIEKIAKKHFEYS